MTKQQKDIECRLLIIGAGPGGYVCAIRAGQLGLDTVIVEKAKPGGTCLNVGCIPSKALIHAADEFSRIVEVAGNKSTIGISLGKPSIDFTKAVHWKDGIVDRLNIGVSRLLKKAGVKQIAGHARFLDGKRVEVETDEGPQVIRSEEIVIATGSEPIELPELPFGKTVLSSTDLLAETKIPQKLAVIGGGYIGLELGMAFVKLGSKVTVIEADDNILPQYDGELTVPILARLRAMGVEVLTNTKAKSVDGKFLIMEGSDNKEARIEVSKILVTVGRRAVLEGWGFDQLAVDMDGRFIKVDDKCRTSMRGIYAIGDVTGEPMLAHRAMAQGEMVAEIVAGHARDWDKYCIPAVCFTDPEIVTAGLSPSEAEDQGHEIKTGLFPFQANGRAMTTEREDGFIRIVARADNHVVLGLQGVGVNMSELAAAFGLAIEMGARLEDIAGTVHAHPTQSEALQEAALVAIGQPLHI